MSEGTAALTGDNGDAGANPANEGAANVAAWNSGFDEGQQAYIDNKGWGSPNDILDSYQNLEKFQGGSKSLIEIPDVDAEADVRDAFYNKLGRPETADGYTFEMPDGGDSELYGWFRDAAHRHGFSENQAAGFLAEYEEMAAARGDAMNTATQEASEKSIEDLKKEWGQGYDAQMDAGKRAVASLGYDEQGLTDLEAQMGTANMLQLFAKIGGKFGEDSFESGDDKGDGFSLTPAAAQAQIDELGLDKNFMEKYMSGDTAAVAKMQRLMKAVHGG